MAYGMSIPDSVSVAAGLLRAGDQRHCRGLRIHVAGESRRRRRTNRAARDAIRRCETCYLERALAAMPRLLGAVDRNPFRPTYGCLDRQYWHYRTSSFPSEMYQEAVLPLALVCATRLPGNRWHGDRRVAELAAAGIRFAARSCHADGSCDDYYPFERALGAAVFSLQAAARAYQLLALDEPARGRLVPPPRALGDRPRRVRPSDQSSCVGRIGAVARGRDHRRGRLPRRRRRPDRTGARPGRDDEGWFEEYGGADPGYQTVTIDCLAKYRRATGDARLDEPLRRAVDFARLFLHPDGSYGGEYGSRGTYHFYPHGMELLAGRDAGRRRTGRRISSEPRLGDRGRFFRRPARGPPTGNLIEAYGDWTPGRVPGAACRPCISRQRQASCHWHPPCLAWLSIQYLPKAGLLVRRHGSTHTVISAARGGVFKHFAHGGAVTTDAGLIVETADGRVAVSQQHDLGREIDTRPAARRARSR